MATLLAVLDEVESAAAILSATGLLAAKWPGASIAVLCVRPTVDPSFMPTEDVMTPAREAKFKAVTAARSAALRHHFETWQKASHAAATARWAEDFGIQAQVVAREAAKADVTLLSQALHRRAEGGPSAVTAALFEAHATVLVMPALSVGKLGAHVAIAWKASEPARRAIQAALPVLRPAQHVTILIGTDDGETPPPDDVIAAITAGGPAPTLHYFGCEGETTGNALLREAAKIGADLLVMGAYSHPRVLEFLLGGATRDVLHAATIPVMMHH